MREHLENSIDNIYDFREKLSATRNNIDNMLNRTVTMFGYGGLPETLPEREFELILQCKGWGIVTEHEGSLIALTGGFAPPNDVYYRPTKCIVNNPWANINHTYTFGEDCVLVRNDPMNRGLLPILRKYGAMITEGDITELLAVINMRAMFALSANDDNSYKSAIKFLEDLEKGKQGSIMSDDFKGGLGSQPLLSSVNGYLTQVIEMQQYIKGCFYQEIGLNATFNMKRERLTDDEVNADSDCLRPLIDSMLEERVKAVKKINEKYGTNITVQFNSSWGKYNVPISNPVDSLSDETEIESNEELFDNEDSMETSTPNEEVEPEDTIENIVEDIKEIVETVAETTEEEGEIQNDDTKN